MNRRYLIETNEAAAKIIDEAKSGRAIMGRTSSGKKITRRKRSHDGWLLKKVKNPKTGNTVQVRSLAPKDQERYRPKDEPYKLDKKVIKGFAKSKKLGNWTTRGDDTLLNKDTGKKYKVKTADDVVRIMGKDYKPDKNKSPQSSGSKIMAYFTVPHMDDGDEDGGGDSDSAEDAVARALKKHGGEISWSDSTDDGYQVAVSIDAEYFKKNKKKIKDDAYMYGNADYTHDEKTDDEKPEKKKKGENRGVVINLKDSSKSAIEGLMRDMNSDYNSLMSQEGEKLSGKKYWEGLAEMAIERAAEEDEDLDELFDKDPEAYDKVVKHYAKKWRAQYE